MIYFHLPRSILQMHRLASTDGNRENIQKIQVRFDESCATNGHHLILLKHRIDAVDKETIELLFPQDANHDESLGEQFEEGRSNLFIPGDIAKQILKGTTKHTQFVFKLDDCFGATIYTRDHKSLKILSQTSFSWDTQNFPDYTQVIPKDIQKSITSFGLSLSLISEFYGYVKAISGNSGAEFNIFPAIKDALSPLKAIVQTDDGELTWVLMPIRI
tara:strand:+ start:1762 stop:2409 length:648 start_codon:yes stop_codon:yes gene_type:complete